MTEPTCNTVARDTGRLLPVIDTARASGDATPAGPLTPPGRTPL